MATVVSRIKAEVALKAIGREIFVLCDSGPRV